MATRNSLQMLGDMKKRKVAKAKVPTLPGAALPMNKLKTWATGPQLKAIGKKARAIVPGKKK